VIAIKVKLAVNHRHPWTLSGQNYLDFDFDLARHAIRENLVHLWNVPESSSTRECSQMARNWSVQVACRYLCWQKLVKVPSPGAGFGVMEVT
jgi:hypothetical protein